MDIAGRTFAALPSWTASRSNTGPSRLSQPAVLDLVTIAFNNEFVIARQIDLLARNLRDPYVLTVVDNSTLRKKRKLIRAACDRAGVGYLGLPSFLLKGSDPSTSHGCALNWAYRKHLRPRNASWFGFLDHDIFPVRPTGVVEALGTAGLWGLVQERAGGWYLWAGFCFFSRETVYGRKLNFLPSPGMDTGGANWGPLFHGIDRSELMPVEHRYGSADREVNSSPQSGYEVIGDWVHTFNASDWMGTGNRDSEIAKTLETLCED